MMPRWPASAKSSVPDATSQTRISRPSEAETTRAPSGVNRALVTGEACPPSRRVLKSRAPALREMISTPYLRDSFEAVAGSAASDTL